MFRRIGWAALRVIYFCVGAALLFGCAASPAQRIDHYAHDYGFARGVIRGGGFTHVVYWNDAFTRNGIIHVYLEGDGTPWLRRYFVARDPTPRHPVMLHLMAMDNAPSLYLGRPCYHGLANRPECRPDYWTHGRYSPAVLESMKSALHRSIDPASATGLYFFGHSGGGALAMLLAERVPQTRGVITLAGNLDTDAWTSYHGFSPLRTSLNPARRAALSSAIIQLHLLGGRDENIPPHLSYAALRSQTQVKIRLFPEFDHTCCWQHVWPEVLGSLPGE